MIKTQDFINDLKMLLIMTGDTDNNAIGHWKDEGYLVIDTVCADYLVIPTDNYHYDIAKEIHNEANSCLVTNMAIYLFESQGWEFLHRVKMAKIPRAYAL